MFTRLSYSVYRRSSGLRYRFERRFTRAGILVFAGAILGAGLGADLEQAVAYQLFSILFALLVVSSLWAFFFRGRFEITRSLPRFGSVGHRVLYKVHVENRTSRKQSGLTLLEKLTDARMTFPEFAAVTKSRANRSFRRAEFRSRRLAMVRPAEIPPVLPGGIANVEVPLVPLRRGTLHFTGASIARPDPFGLVRAFVDVRAPDTITILPRRYALPPITLPGTLKYQQGGVALASSVGESEEFVSLREYRRGDPMRHIHWKSWARTGKPIIKEFQDEFFVRHALILDTFGSNEKADVFEEAVSVAASFACAIRTQESLLDLMFVGPQALCLTSGRGLAHAEQMLEVLAAVQMCTDKPFRSLETLVLQHISGVSGCLCIFIEWDESRQNLVQLLRAFGLPVLVLLIAREGSQTDPGPLNSDPGSFRVLELGRIAEDLQKL